MDLSGLRAYRWAPDGVIAAVLVGIIQGTAGGEGHLGMVAVAGGAVAMYLLFALALWPHIWWATSLGMVEEAVATSILSGTQAALSWNVVVHHWTSTITGINTYPIFTAPAVGIMCEFAYRSWKRGNAWRGQSSETADE